jgi:putative hydrolase
MKYLADTHTHTIASGHAYNTIDEMTKKAAQLGLSHLAITDHAPKMPGSCGILYFSNFRVIPRSKFGVTRIMGCEANIIDYTGKVDMPQKMLKDLELVIASLHIPCIKPGTVSENTQALIGAIKNPYINIIGHPDDSRYPVDMEAVVAAAKENHTLLELNNTSLKPDSPRSGAMENDLKMLQLCKENGVCISIGSDAHVEEDICNYSYAEELLKKTDFPDELIVNLNINLLKTYLNFVK